MNALAVVLALALPQDLEAFGRGIEASLRKGDPAPLDKAVDADLLLDRALKGLNVPAESTAGFRAGTKKSFEYGKALLRQMGKEGTFTFLRVREKRAVFRMLVGESFSYQEFLLDPRAGGEVRIADLYIHLSAEWMSESLRRTYLTVLSSEPGALEKALGSENEYVASLPRMRELSKLVREGKHAEMLKRWDELPASARKDKSMLVMRCTAAAQVGGEESLRAIEELRKALPGDPCLPVLSIGPLTEAGKDEEALKAVDELDRALGGDPFLHVLRSWIHSGAGRIEKARECARKAADAEKALAIAYWTLVNLTLAEKKFGETAKVLSELEKNTGIRVDALRGEQFAEFLKSPEYAAWKKARP